MNTKNLPNITYAIVVFNEQKRIASCIEAILRQDYPKFKKEIIVMDGGSTDNTREIARKYHATVYHNPLKLAEPGLALAYKKAKGDYMVFMAADNILFDPNWTQKMITPFRDRESTVYASFSKVVNDPQDNAWNKYINEDTDPFSAFVFGNASHPDKFAYIYKKEIQTPDYIIYNYSSQKFPLIALAQGTMLKTKLVRSDHSHFDDMLPLIHILDQGKKIAYVTNTGIYHYSVTSFENLCTKFKNRIFNAMRTNSYKSREQYVSPIRKMKRYLFMIYSFTIVFPLIDGIRLAIRKRKFYMLLHPVASFIIAFYILYNFITIAIWQKSK